MRSYCELETLPRPVSGFPVACSERRHLDVRVPLFTGTQADDGFTIITSKAEVSLHVSRSRVKVSLLVQLTSVNGVIISLSLKYHLVTRGADSGVMHNLKLIVRPMGYVGHCTSEIGWLLGQARMGLLMIIDYP